MDGTRTHAITRFKRGFYIFKSKVLTKYSLEGYNYLTTNNYLKYTLSS